MRLLLRIQFLQQVLLQMFLLQNYPMILHQIHLLQ